MPIFLENCFGCCPLRKAVLSIGYLFLFLTLAIFASQSFVVISFFVTFDRSGARDFFINIMSIIMMAVFTLVLSVVLLICGAHKGNRYLMLPFVSVLSILSAHIVFFEFLCCIFLVSELISLALSFFVVGVLLFIEYVILSHHHELKKHTLDNREDDEVCIVNSA